MTLGEFIHLNDETLKDKFLRVIYLVVKSKDGKIIDIYDRHTVNHIDDLKPIFHGMQKFFDCKVINHFIKNYKIIIEIEEKDNDG